MQKSKLFSDVHVSVPHVSPPPGAVTQPSALATSTVQTGTVSGLQKKRWLIVGGVAIATMVALSSFFTATPSKPKVVVIKAPAAFSAVDATAANNAAIAAALKTTASAVEAATTPMTRTIASQATELANLQQQLALTQAKLNETTARANARIVPTEGVLSQRKGYSPPVPIDQHGVLLTVNGSPFQCSAREGRPVCISIGGYIPPAASGNN